MYILWNRLWNKTQVLVVAVINKLTALQVKNAKKPIGDGGGLWLKVKSDGRKSWVFRYCLHGRHREMGLGPLHDTNLQQARGKAARCREQLHQGIDPIEARKQELLELRLQQTRSRTFDDCAEAFIESRETEWRNEKHRNQWKNTLKTYASPVIGKLPVADVDIDHVMKIVEPIWGDKTETATRVRQRIERVLDWATVRKYRTGDNPARWQGNLKELLPNPSKIRQVKPHPAMPYQQAGEFMKTLREKNVVSAHALEFCILTVARTTPVIGAKWSEIDQKAGTWTVPGDRMKGGKTFIVPLSSAALKLINSLHREDGIDYVFPGARHGKHLSTGAMDKLLQDALGYPQFTVHGFRSTFRDWAAELTNYPQQILEMTMAHELPNKVEAAYLRSDLLEKRRQVLESWASFLGKAGSDAEVIPLNVESALG